MAIIPRLDAPDTTLNYAPGPERRREAIARAMVKPLIAAGVIAALFLWGPVLLRWVEIMHWQARCLGYAAPPSHLVLDCDVVHHRILSQDTNADRAHLVALSGRPSFAQLPTAFLHQLSRPGLAPELVCVEVTPPQIVGGAWGLCFYPEEWSIASFGHEPQWLQPSTSAFMPFSPQAQRVKVYAGQVDPNDPSHFTIDYEVDGLRKTVDGWLTARKTVLIAARP